MPGVHFAPETQGQRRVQFAAPTRPSQMGIITPANTSTANTPVARTQSTAAMNAAAETEYLHNDIQLHDHAKLSEFQDLCKSKIKKAHLHQFIEGKPWTGESDKKLIHELKLACGINLALTDISPKQLHKTIETLVGKIKPDYTLGTQGNYYKAHKHLKTADTKRNGDHSLVTATNGQVFSLVSHLTKEQSRTFLDEHHIALNSGKVSIGKGGHGNVKVAQSFTNPKQLYAYKKIKNIKDGMAELQATAGIKDAYGLVKPVAFAHIKQHGKEATFIFYPLYEGGNGGKEMEKIQKCKTDDPAAAKSIFKKTFVHYLESVINLHLQKIAHRDLKLGNFVHSNVHGTGLTDFGYAQPIKDITECTGTPGYLPPEKGTDKYTGLTHDAFSLGRIGLELKWGQYNVQDIEQPHLIIQGKPITLTFDKDNNIKGLDLKALFPQGLSYTTQDEIIAGLLALDPAERLTPTQAINSGFLRETAIKFGSEHID
ncbi:MAG: hypothetical protein VX185_12270 [Pseudomonadota bacterium]|nr:hypothetical protein [Pseudomonadota bacterium]